MRPAFMCTGNNACDDLIVLAVGAAIAGLLVAIAVVAGLTHLLLLRAVKPSPASIALAAVAVTALALISLMVLAQVDIAWVRVALGGAWVLCAILGLAGFAHLLWARRVRRRTDGGRQ